MTPELFLGPPPRHRAQRIERGEGSRVGLVEQAGDALALVVVEGGNESGPQPLLGSVADLADEALQYRRAGQEHFIGDEPGDGPFEQQHRAVIAGPAQRVEPSGKSETCCTAGREFPETILGSNLDEMALALPAAEIRIERDIAIQIELLSQIAQDRCGDIGSLIGKGAEKPGAAERQGKAKTVVIAAELADRLLVDGIEVEVSRKLFRRGGADETTVLSTLLIGQDADGHAVRNSRVLRREARRRNSAAFSVAKHVCETLEICNKICEPFGAAA